MSIVENTPAIRFERELLSIDPLGTFKRRKWTGVAVIVLGMAATIATTLLWPAAFQSTATILIEEPDVPDDLVRSTVSTFAQDRLQVIQQRVMTSQNLSDIVDRFSLYQGMWATQPRSEIINALRDSIDLEVVSADFLSPQQTRPSPQTPQATISFTVSYSSSDPRIAQQVTSRLADLYLAENVQSRQQKATGTAEFLAQQSDRLYQDVQEYEKKLTDFKTKYAGSLPEQLVANMQILGQAQAELSDSRRNIDSLLDKKAFLASQLSQISPYQPMTAQGQAATPQAQLMSLELQYVDLSAKYGPKHPDVVHLQKQIDVLRSQTGASGDQGSGQAKLTQLQAQLQDALQKYGEKHPQVQNLRQQIDSLRGELAKAPQVSMITAPKGPPDNPMYIQLQNEMGDVSSQLQGLQMQLEPLQKTVESLQAKVLQTPALEGEYASLTQQYQAAVTRYQSFKDKEADARVAESMEQQSKGETFSVIQAPEVPDVPITPNRKLLLVAGAAVSMLLAASAMVARELLDSRIYEPNGLQMVFGEVPLATVPYIVTPRERAGRMVKFGIGSLVVVGAITVGLLVVDAMYMPLDVLVASIMQRFQH